MEDSHKDLRALIEDFNRAFLALMEHFNRECLTLIEAFRNDNLALTYKCNLKEYSEFQSRDKKSYLRRRFRRTRSSYYWRIWDWRGVTSDKQVIIYGSPWLSIVSKGERPERETLLFAIANFCPARDLDGGRTRNAATDCIGGPHKKRGWMDGTRAKEESQKGEPIRRSKVDSSRRAELWLLIFALKWTWRDLSRKTGPKGKIKCKL